MAGFKTGVVIGAMVVGFPAAWLLSKIESQPIMFSSYYVGVQPDYVSVTGSVIGDDKLEKDRPINNGIQMTCWRPNGFCQYMNVDEIGPNLIGQINSENLTVRKWDDKELVADSFDISNQYKSCNYYEIRVLLKNKIATYTRLPNQKADLARCKMLFGESQPLRQWRIGDGKSWSGYNPGL